MFKFKFIDSKYTNSLLQLAWPMIIGNLGIILLGVGDVFVAGRHSTQTLAAISIANSFMGCIFIFGIGILLSISPLLSNFRGAKEQVSKYFLPTIHFALIVGLFATLLMLACIPLVNIVGFEQELMKPIKDYIFIIAFSTFGAYVQAALKEFLQTYEIVMFANMLSIAGVFINLALCFIFVFGLLGFPEMGAVGLAWATFWTRLLLGIIMVIFCLRIIKVKKYTDYGYFVKLIKIGMPIALAILMENIAFNIITIVVGRTSGVYAAANNILITLITTTFMVPLAISNAIAVKVGFANGAGNIEKVKKYAFSGIGLSMGFMSICAILFIFYPQLFIRIFTQDPVLIKICTPILLLAGIFQIFDGMQVSLGGVFKGLKKTRTIMIGVITAYWLIGLPIGFILGTKYNLQLFGFWIGLTISLCALAIIFLFLLLKELNKKTKKRLL